MKKKRLYLICAQIRRYFVYVWDTTISFYNVQRLDLLNRRLINAIYYYYYRVNKKIDTFINDCLRILDRNWTSNNYIHSKSDSFWIQWILPPLHLDTYIQSLFCKGVLIFKYKIELVGWSKKVFTPYYSDVRFKR